MLSYFLKLMYHDDDDDDRSNLTKIVIVALISATSAISLISFSSYNAEARTFVDDNNIINSTLLTELFTTDKQSLVTVNGATTTDPSNTITKFVPSLIATGSYMHPYIGITGFDVRPDIAKAMGLQKERGFLVADATAEDPSDKAGIESGGDLLTDINGRYIEISRIINVPKTTPNSSSSLTSGNPTSDILTYQNSSYGITIHYPANWTVDEEDSDPNDNITNIVTFVSPLENTSDNYSENLGIGLERLTDQNMTLDEYTSSLITDYNNTSTDFNLNELNTNITLGGSPAYGLLYTDREDGTNYKTMEIGTIIGDRVFYIEYIAEENKYSNYLPTIQMMINSFRVT
jgi:hypothetical protein